MKMNGRKIRPTAKPVLLPKAFASFRLSMMLMTTFTPGIHMRRNRMPLPQARSNSSYQFRNGMIACQPGLPAFLKIFAIATIPMIASTRHTITMTATTPADRPAAAES